MDVVNKYFASLLFTQIDQKQSGGSVYTVYGAGISGAYGDGSQRYVLLFVPQHLALQRQARIQDLQWINIQTRTIKGGYRLKQQRFVPPNSRDDPNLTVVERTERYTMYRDGNFEMLLLHDPKKKTRYQFYGNMSLFSGFDTFNCVVNYVASPADPFVELL